MSAESLLVHIEALRKMLLEILAVFIILLVPGWYFAADILIFLQNVSEAIASKHGAKESFELYYFSPLEPFLLELKAGSILALAAGIPLYFRSAWRFLAPALYRHEKRLLLIGSTAAWLLFVAGCVMGFLGVMPLLIKFSYGFARDGLMPMIGYGNFLELAMTIALAFGLMFEFPLILLILAAAGVIKLETLQKQRPLVLVVILILAAVLTPPDVISQMLLAVPTWVLFELMLLCGKMVIKKPSSGEELSEYNDLPEVLPESVSGNIGVCSGICPANAAEKLPSETAFMPNCYRRPRKRHKPSPAKPGRKSGYNYHA